MKSALRLNLANIDWATLDPEALEIARLIVDGYKPREIATILNLDHRTVRRRLNQLETTIRQQAAGEQLPRHPTVTLTTHKLGRSTVPETPLTYTQRGTMPLEPTMNQLTHYQIAAEKQNLSLNAWALQQLDKAAAK